MEVETNKNFPDTSSTLSTSSITQKKKDKKYVFYRKPSLKMKGPEVKQTKTSMKRLLIANPLLKYEQDGIELPKLEKPTSSDLETLPEKPQIVNKPTNLQRSKISGTISSKSNKMVGIPKSNTYGSSSNRFKPSNQAKAKDNTIKRRSISAEHFERTKGKHI